MLAVKYFVTERNRPLPHVSHKTRISNKDTNRKSHGLQFFRSPTHRLQYSTIRQISQTGRHRARCRHRRKGVLKTKKHRQPPLRSDLRIAPAGECPQPVIGLPVPSNAVGSANRHRLSVNRRRGTESCFLQAIRRAKPGKKCLAPQRLSVVRGWRGSQEAGGRIPHLKQLRERLGLRRRGRHVPRRRQDVHVRQLRDVGGVGRHAEVPGLGVEVRERRVEHRADLLRGAVRQVQLAGHGVQRGLVGPVRDVHAPGPVGEFGGEVGLDLGGEVPPEAGPHVVLPEDARGLPLHVGLGGVVQRLEVVGARGLLQNAEGVGCEGRGRAHVRRVDGGGGGSGPGEGTGHTFFAIMGEGQGNVRGVGGGGGGGRWCLGPKILCTKNGPIRLSGL